MPTVIPSAQGVAPRTMTPQDSRFLQQAIVAGDREILAARAEQRSRDRRVAFFARVMLRDHVAANGQLAALASERNVPYSHRTVQETDQNGKRIGPSMSPNAAGPMLPARTYMAQQIREASRTTSGRPWCKNSIDRSATCSPS